ncbi:hypothetical protein WS98_21930 [Burkholderia territorii]|uniref:Uncharacterized protein n=1 Tax=Burkholderia cepacia TaxID=292 RepID=A0A2S8IFE2_BURCE|nr:MULTISPECIES: hypothetical protein [Burkholderia cepacia complex]KVL32199.1 hypothetical protein WS98_21930 [Burkholderia territorii]MCA7888588.1 hypothetical protein [Burkholderia contaminans]PQP13122.1 hypothetical protein C5615_29875 [Burkholderia cepacia]HDR9510423.1 hypothetical protein [Burkholderia cepacia]
MDTEAANKLQEQIQGSREKYIYFLLTAAGGCIGYAVEKVAGSVVEWKLIALALSLIAWGISFWFGCRAVKRNEYGLRYNHAYLTAARSPMDKAALDSLMSDEATASASSNRWQFRFFVLGGVAFVLWRLLELLHR